MGGPREQTDANDPQRAPNTQVLPPQPSRGHPASARPAMATPPDLQTPAWAIWAALAALALLGALVAAVGLGLRRAGGDGRDTFWGHVSDLRRRIVRMVLALVAGLAFVFTFRLESASPWLGIDPYDNLASQVYRRMVADLVPDDVQLVVLRPTDGFVAVFEVALGLAVLVTLPYLLLQLAGFVAPALRNRERRLLAWYLAPAAALFALGALLAYVAILPQAFTALYTFSTNLGATNLLDVHEFVAFAVMMMLMSGAAFLTPLVMFGLARIGVAGPRSYLRYWRHTVVAVVILAGLVTPDPTPVSQILVAGPLVGLYFLGILVSFGARRSYERANP